MLKKKFNYHNLPIHLNIQIISKNSEFFPKNLCLLPDCPEILFVLGNKNILKHFSISIVGTRNSSFQGNEIASNIAKELSSYNITIVSGLASGIDTHAHLGAIQNKNNIQNIDELPNKNVLQSGSTIAIIACGFNHIFTPKNTKLINDILDSGGAIISEYFPDTPPQKFTFLKRNRLIAAISNATIIVEAPLKSGALCTANIAQTLNKPIFSIPWSINISRGQGCNQLLENNAHIFTNCNSILNFFNIPRNSTPSQINNSTLNSKLAQHIPKDFVKLYDYIKKNEPVNKNKIYTHFKDDSISSLNSKLTLMELQFLIKFKRK